MGRARRSSSAGAAWVFTRNNGTWTQLGNKLVGAGAEGNGILGNGVAISADSSTIVLGAPGDNSGIGAAWVFVGSERSIPAPGAVTPASGSGASTTLTFTFSDTGGTQAFTVLDVLIRDVLDGRHACYVAFVPSSGSVLLVDDAGDAGGPYSGMVLPGSGTVSNSQCSIAAAASSVSTSGDTLTLTLAINFTSVFAGNKVIYMSAQDASANSGWFALGTWNIPGSAISGPGVGGVTPGHSTGFAQTFQFTFTDTNGFQDIAVADVLINNAIDGRHACYVALVPINASSISVLLVDDSGDAGGPFSGMVVPGSGTVSNSQCSIAGAGNAVNASGNTLTVTLPITFTQSFTGNQIVYAAARNNNGQNSGWQAVGTTSVR